MLCFGRQRYDFESNSQLTQSHRIFLFGCVSDVKDTILKAIHNPALHGRSFEGAVFRTSKIRFWKQFTTACTVGSPITVLCFGRQRYDFESNSQRIGKYTHLIYRCVSDVKDTILKAIHNKIRHRLLSQRAVFRTSKIRFWKQFTTSLRIPMSVHVLCFGRQRYDFESNSQRPACLSSMVLCCVSDVKDTILKAIHNKVWVHGDHPFAVFRTSKIRFWKQFTTPTVITIHVTRLCFGRQRYDFESNSQRTFKRGGLRTRCVSDVKDTILKAIHNVSLWQPESFLAVFRTSKIRFWKQFTTDVIESVTNLGLCFGRQRYDFESNSQLVGSLSDWDVGCVSDVKDTILKAIHNRTTCTITGGHAVFRTSKIRFWKQFTTCSQSSDLKVRSVSDVKDTILKAIHNTH